MCTSMFGRTNKQTDRQRNRWTDGNKHNFILVLQFRWTNKQTDGQTGLGNYNVDMVIHYFVQSDQDIHSLIRFDSANYSNVLELQYVYIF